MDSEFQINDIRTIAEFKGESFSKYKNSLVEGFASANSTSIGPEFSGAKSPEYIMNPSKWFYNRGSNSAVYKNYFERAKQLMLQYGIKSTNYKHNTIGYLSENKI